MKQLFKILLLLALPAALLAQPNQGNNMLEQKYFRESIWCTMPLQEGYRWQYDILKAGKAVGQLKVEIQKKSKLKTKVPYAYGNKTKYYDQTFTLYRLAFIDTFKNKRYQKTLLANWGELYEYKGKRAKSYPFLKNRLRVGDQLASLLVVDIDTQKFAGKEIKVARLQSLNDNNYIEHYGQRLGLMYHKNGDLEYILTSSTIRPADIVESCHR